MTVVNYKTIIDNVQSVLTEANTVTADYDLSTNMASRVSTISQRNPSFLVSQPSLFPILCIRIDSDDKEHMEVGATTNPKQSMISLSLIGCLWYNALSETTPDDDTSDREIHYFAENVEEVLRRNSRLNNSVLNSTVDGCRFYEDLDEEAYFRTFVIDYKVRKFY